MDNLPLPKVDWGEILQTPPVNLEDLYPGGFGEGLQPEVDDFDADPRSPNPELEKPFFEPNDLAAPGIDQLFGTGNPPNASDIRNLAESQNFTRVQNPNGPIKYVDGNGVIRITIKQGSQRAQGSGSPHVELRYASGQRVDPFGNPVTRKSPGNHTPINYDL
ncbi:hypothetical protein [Adonisia turfae]|uniref:Uncharacterized protein n=1 Tax=Adonisia turfae CCMR0081 TaxID=2292702 RepID=A0A6M0RJT8_9CYAN|nr:hypothetical protein [Adonisia turfae]NEZ56466.1 hypothetical protein [Adonisia turfae CCMR0081]